MKVPSARKGRAPGSLCREVCGLGTEGAGGADLSAKGSRGPGCWAGIVDFVSKGMGKCGWGVSRAMLGHIRCRKHQSAGSHTDASLSEDPAGVGRWLLEVKQRLKMLSCLFFFNFKFLRKILFIL